MSSWFVLLSFRGQRRGGRWSSLLKLASVPKTVGTPGGQIGGVVLWWQKCKHARTHAHARTHTNTNAHTVPYSFSHRHSLSHSHTHFHPHIKVPWLQGLERLNTVYLQLHWRISFLSTYTPPETHVCTHVHADCTQKTWWHYVFQLNSSSKLLEMSASCVCVSVCACVCLYLSLCHPTPIYVWVPGVQFLCLVERPLYVCHHYHYTMSTLIVLILHVFAVSVLWWSFTCKVVIHPDYRNTLMTTVLY